MSPRRFFAILWGSTLAGFLGCWWMASLVTAWDVPWWFPVLGLGVMMGGMAVTMATPDWRGSLAGHLVASAGAGATLGPLFDGTTSPAVRSAGMAIAGSVVLLGLVTVAIPKTAQIFGTCVPAVALCLAGNVWLWPTAWIALGTRPVDVWLVIITLLVTAYIDFYWMQAARLPATADNAIDSACAMYLDPWNRALMRLERTLGRPVSARRLVAGRTADDPPRN